MEFHFSIGQKRHLLNQSTNKPFRHVSTFLALGFVLWPKTNKKGSFVCASAKLSNQIINLSRDIIHLSENCDVTKIFLHSWTVPLLSTIQLNELKLFSFSLKYTYLTALLSDIITLLLMLELRLVHCFDDADTLSSDRFFLLHKSSLFS